MHRCPIPTCRKPLASRHFMCKKHSAMIPKVIAAAIEQTGAMLRGPLPPDEHKTITSSNRQARALAFAAVCEQLGIDLDAIFKQVVAPPQEVEADTQSLRAAITRALNDE